MKLKLVLKFSDAERQELLRFQNVINVPGQPALSLEQICRQSIFWAVNEAYRRGQELAKKEQVDGREVRGDTPADPQPAPVSQDADSTPLADSQNAAPQG